MTATGLRGITAVILLWLSTTALWAAELRATGDMGVIIERADGSVRIVEHSTNTDLGRITNLGDLSHASIVYSRDQRYAYIFGRDGGLTKIDILKQKVDKRIIQSGNSIGGAISQDGSLVAVSNYEPGGVKVFDSNSLELIADLPAISASGFESKVVGLVDAPDNHFVFSLFEAGEIWVADMAEPYKPVITKYTDVGRQPYDALISPDGRFYIAGLFGEDGMALLDLWNPQAGVKRILGDYGKGEQKLPVYKMPHLEGWAIAGQRAFVPGVGRHSVLVIDTNSWTQVGEIPVHGQPVFVMARPDNRQIWVNFAFPNNDTIQVIDAQQQKIIQTLTPGKGVLHMEFTPRGENVWLSVRDLDRVDILRTRDYQRIGSFEVLKPSGIFFTSRAHEIGL